MPRWTFEYKVTLGNLLTMALALIPAVYAYAVLTNTVATSAEAVKSIPAIESRVSTIETRINLGQAAREQFQEETKAALRDQAVKLDKMSDSISALAAAVSGLTATLKERAP